MLSPNEFTVGCFADAKPVSLILPRTQYEETVLIGHMDTVPVAVFLSGRHAFRCFESADNKHWEGLIIPDVRVEVDETSLFNLFAADDPSGAAVRMDTRLVVFAKHEHPFGRSTPITLQDSLTPVGEFKAGFQKWQVVIGEGYTKRVLWRAPDPTPAS